MNVQLACNVEWSLELLFGVIIAVLVVDYIVIRVVHIKLLCLIWDIQSLCACVTLVLNQFVLRVFLAWEVHLKESPIP
jgi:hypothetical protein